MVSEITRKKLSDSHKGKMPKFMPNNKGRVHTKESRLNMSLAHRGKKLSAENKRKIGEANKGKHGKTEEWKKKMSVARSGSKNPMYGKTGDKHPMWKGGVTPVHNKIRSSIESKLWIQSVFARDGYTCQKTGVKGGKLTAHHILNFAQYPELRFAIDNGITLSVESHKLFHRIYGVRNNTREQLQEFLDAII
jgi:hypothetical protein